VAAPSMPPKVGRYDYNSKLRRREYPPGRACTRKQPASQGHRRRSGDEPHVRNYWYCIGQWFTGLPSAGVVSSYLSKLSPRSCLVMQSHPLSAKASPHRDRHPLRLAALPQHRHVSNMFGSHNTGQQEPPGYSPSAPELHLVPPPFGGETYCWKQK
jgi:hypothetical protein